MNRVNSPIASMAMNSQLQTHIGGKDIASARPVVGGGPENTPETRKVSEDSRVVIPAMMHPIFRTQFALDRGVERNLVFKTFGGLGDQICSEPTLRHAIKMFKDCEISLAAEVPELFRHLKFKRVFNLKEESPNWRKYFVFETITPPDESNLVWCFVSHLLTNCVDFPSICALRSMLPVSEREIQLHPETPANHGELTQFLQTGVLVHAGRHWQSKTFPKEFWDEVLRHLKLLGLIPILIGADTDDNRGTVDVDATGCIDLRNKLSINDSIWLCKNAAVLLTNDSAPLHMAAAGDAFVGYIATCKHPDMITHWRKGMWQWREVNFSSGGIWDILDYCPNKQQKVEVEFVEPSILESWLPDPADYAFWAAQKHKEFYAEDIF